MWAMEESRLVDLDSYAAKNRSYDVNSGKVGYGKPGHIVVDITCVWPWPFC